MKRKFASMSIAVTTVLAVAVSLLSAAPARATSAAIGVPIGMATPADTPYSLGDLQIDGFDPNSTITVTVGSSRAITGDFAYFELGETLEGISVLNNESFYVSFSGLPTVVQSQLELTYVTFQNEGDYSLNLAVDDGFGTIEASNIISVGGLFASPGAQILAQDGPEIDDAYLGILPEGCVVPDHSEILPGESVWSVLASGDETDSLVESVDWEAEGCDGAEVTDQNGTYETLLPFEMPFTTNFFGQEQNHFWISSNGFISFNSPSGEYDQPVRRAVVLAQSSTLMALGADQVRLREREIGAFTYNSDVLLDTTTTVGGNSAVIVTYRGFGFYTEGDDPGWNTYQIAIVDRSEDSGVTGDADYFFNYSQISTVANGYVGPYSGLDVVNGIDIEEDMVTVDSTEGFLNDWVRLTSENDDPWEGVLPDISALPVTLQDGEEPGSFLAGHQNLWLVVVDKNKVQFYSDNPDNGGELVNFVQGGAEWLAMSATYRSPIWPVGYGSFNPDTGETKGTELFGGLSAWDLYDGGPSKISENRLNSSAPGRYRIFMRDGETQTEAPLPGENAELLVPVEVVEVELDECTALVGVELGNYGDDLELQVTLSMGSAWAGFQITELVGGARLPNNFGDWDSETTDLSMVAFIGYASALNEQLSKVNVCAFGGSVEVSVSVGLVGSAMDPSSGHFYVAQYGEISWREAKEQAAASTAYGRQGYMLTLTSREESLFVENFINTNTWIGLSDDYREINAVLGSEVYDCQYAGDGCTNPSEGRFYWVTGPEAGTLVSVGNSIEDESEPIAQGNNWTNWFAGEPNDYENEDESGDWPGEYYGVTWSDGDLPWNDLPDNYDIESYVIEYGDMPGDLIEESNLYKSGTFTISAATHFADCPSTAANPQYQIVEFANPQWTDPTNEDLNLYRELCTIGTVSIFDGGDKSVGALTAALDGVQAFVVPEGRIWGEDQEDAWFYQRDDIAEYLNEWVNDGGILITTGAYRHRDIVARSAGVALDYVGNDGSIDEGWSKTDYVAISDAPSALGVTSYSGGWFLDSLDATDRAELEAAGFKPLYWNEASQNLAVGIWEVGKGASFYFGWDWYVSTNEEDISPEPTAIQADWNRALRLAVGNLLVPVEGNPIDKFTPPALGSLSKLPVTFAGKVRPSNYTGWRLTEAQKAALPSTIKTGTKLSRLVATGTKKQSLTSTLKGTSIQVSSKRFARGTAVKAKLTLPNGTVIDLGSGESDDGITTLTGVQFKKTGKYVLTLTSSTAAVQLVVMVLDNTVNIHFSRHSAVLSAKVKAALKSMYIGLRGMKSLTIDGHIEAVPAPTRGKEEAKGVALARAKAIATYVQSLGYRGAIKLVDRGATKPATTDRTESWKNRRGVIRFS